MSKPMIPWMGGKGRLVKHILPLFPAHECYVELFAGGAALFYKKEPSKVEVLNDLNGELVNLYRVAKHHLEEFVHQFNFALASRQMYEWEKLKVPETLTDIQRAARFYYLQRLAFGAKLDHVYGTSTTAPPKLRVADVGAELADSWQRLANANIENLDWYACATKYDRPHTFIYMDPPYWETEGYGVDFGWEQYEKMAEFMATMQGKAILSINDHPDIRRLFKGFKTKKVSVTYTVGKEGRNKRSELIIMSW